MLPSCWHDDLYQLLQNAGIPVVMLDQIPASMRHFPVDCVISDNYRGGALLAEHLLEKTTQRSGSWNSIWTPTISSSSGSRASGMYIRKMALTFCNSRILFPCFFWFHCRNDHPEQPAFPEAYWFFRSPYCCFWLLSLRNGWFKRCCQPGTDFRSSGYFLCVLWWWSAFQDHEAQAATCVSQDLTSMGKHAVELLLKRIHGDYTDFPKIDMLDVVFHPRRP